jgi:dTDP-4-dehydrorhamnose reductase
MGNPVIVVTGKNGQLGSELQQLVALFPGFDFLFTARTDLDITNEQQVENYFSAHPVNYCINAAAYTAVDKAESERELALAINEHAVANLAKACDKHGCRLIHISTDYVFDGSATAPYDEEHPVKPVNFYGETKLKGEQAALFHHPASIVIRTSWVYSSFGNNFVKTMLRLMKDRPSINVVNDQVGSPTYAADLALAILQVVQFLHQHTGYKGGIYHYSNEGVISWYEFAVAIKQFSNSGCQVNPIPSSDYPTPAKRPAYSGLSKEKIKADFGVYVPGWYSSLQKFFALVAPVTGNTSQ